MAYAEDKKEQKKEYKPMSQMTYKELRELANVWDFEISSKMDDNARIARKWLNMPLAEFKSSCAIVAGKKGYIHEEFGSVKGNSIIIPYGWENLPTLYSIIQLRVEEMHRVNFADCKIKELQDLVGAEEYSH